MSDWYATGGDYPMRTGDFVYDTDNDAWCEYGSTDAGSSAWTAEDYSYGDGCSARVDTHASTKADCEKPLLDEEKPIDGTRRGMRSSIVAKFFASRACMFIGLALVGIMPLCWLSIPIAAALNHMFAGGSIDIIWPCYAAAIVESCLISWRIVVKGKLK